MNEFEEIFLDSPKTQDEIVQDTKDYDYLRLDELSSLLTWHAEHFGEDRPDPDELVSLSFELNDCARLLRSYAEFLRNHPHGV